MSRRSRTRARSLPCPLNLITESAEHLDRMREDLDEAIVPRDFIEDMYVEDINQLTVDINRLRRSKTALINLAFQDALKEILVQLLLQPGEAGEEREAEAEELSRRWFADPNAKLFQVG